MSKHEHDTGNRERLIVAIWEYGPTRNNEWRCMNCGETIPLTDAELAEAISVYETETERRRRIAARD